MPWVTGLVRPTRGRLLLAAAAAAALCAAAAAAAAEHPLQCCGCAEELEGLPQDVLLPLQALAGAVLLQEALLLWAELLCMWSMGEGG
jgi:hypothetical protein